MLYHFSGTPLTVLSVLIGVHMWGITSQQLIDGMVILALTCPVIILLNFSLRTAIILITRHYGLWDPRFDYFWPRLPWRPVWRAMSWTGQWWDRMRGMGRPSANWTGVLSSLCLLFRPGTLLIGRARLWFGASLQPMGLPKVKRHLMLIAETGVGKTTFLITLIALLNPARGAWILDPKGQIYRALSSALKGKGHRVWRFDPLMITKGSECINLLDMITYVNAVTGRDYTSLIIKKIVRADFPDNPKTEPIWINGPRAIWTALVTYVYSLDDPSKRSLVYARDLLTRGFWWAADSHAEAMFVMWAYLSRYSAHGEEISSGAALMAGKMNNTKESFMVSLLAATAYLDSPFLRPLLQHSTCEPWAMKGRNDVFFAIAPVSEIKGDFQPIFRQFTALSLYAHEILPNDNVQHSTLFACDEFPNLGYMPDVEAALPVLRGYKVTFLGIAQNIELLKGVYPKSWGGFLGGADATFYMAINHEGTAAHLSKQLGIRSYKRKEPVSGQRKWYRLFRRPKRIVREQFPLMTPEQIKRYTSEDRMIVVRFGNRPIKTQTMPYYNWLPVTAYEADPEHGDTPSRAKGRKAAADLSAWAIRARAALKERFGRPMPESDARAILGGLAGDFTRGDLDARASLAARTFNSDLVAAAKRALAPLAQ